MVDAASDLLALPLVHYSASLVAPPWGPYPRELELEGTLLRVREVELREELGQPWQLCVHITSDHPQFDPARLVGSEFSLHMLREDASHAAENDGRFLHGVVLRASYIGSFSDAFHARLWVGPVLQMLGSGRRSRIFQDLSVVEIVQALASELLEARGRELQVDRLTRTYAPRDYCVQYQESDLAFAQRILAEEGIALAFEADDAHECTVLVDDEGRFGSVLRTVEGLQSPSPPQHVSVRADRGELAAEETVASFSWRRSVHAARTTVEQWDWKQAAPGNLEARLEPQGGEAPHQFGERYHHGELRLQEAERGTGPHLDGSLARAERSGHYTSRLADHFEGSGNVMSMTPGATFELDEHPDSELNGPYYCVRVTHYADNTDTERGGTGGRNYDNTFTCAALATRYAPSPPPRPRIFGLQTATVVGPDAEEIHTDGYGRVQVRMHWDREQRDQDQDTTCWLRVVQSWAGAGFGSQFIPRVGMEVLVSFLDGNPDRPVCMGAVYNGRNLPPYALPDDKTKSGIRTRSSPGGEGSNELRFDDAAGGEEIYLHAQKDLNEVVEAAHSMGVGSSQSVSVGSDQSVHVGATRTVRVTGDQTLEVGVPPPPDAAAGQGGGPATHTLDVFGDISQVASQTIDIDGKVSITLRCGGSTMVMTPQTITLTAGGGASVALGPGIAMASAHSGMTVAMDEAGAMTMTSSTGTEIKLDSAIDMKSAAQSTLGISDTVGLAASGGAKLDLSGDIEMGGAKLTAQASQSKLVMSGGAELTGASVTLGAGGSELSLDPAQLQARSNMVDITGVAMVSIGAPNVKIN